MADEMLAEAIPESGSRDVRSSVRDELGQLWASIFFAPGRKSPKTLLVASAERREGATQLAAALGVVGAQSHRELKILLVDFNLHHPGLHKALDQSGGPGLAELVRGDLTLDEAAQPAGPSNLLLLSAGRDLSQPLGLLRSERLKDVLAGFQDHTDVDHVIIDAGAANHHPEAQTLAGLLDGVILVTHAGETRRESVAEAKKRIEQNQGRLLGIVLNQRRFPIPGFLYKRL